MAVKFGIQLPSFTFPNRRGENVFKVGREIAQTAEATGFDSVWLMDHLFQIPVVAPEADPLLECWTGLAALAASTTKLKLGSMVTAAGFRNPSILAKMTSTIDVISNGRLIVGIGAGWCDWEHKAYGIDFPPVGVRMQKLEDAINVLKAMWTEERATYEGAYYSVRGAINAPKPVQKPHPPILIGGSGEKVTLRITAQYAQQHNLGGGTPEQAAHTLSILRQHCHQLGTDYEAILKTRLSPVMFANGQRELEEKTGRLCPAGATKDHFLDRTFTGTAEQIAAHFQKFVDVGVTYFIISLWDIDNLDELRRFGNEVIARFA